MKSWLLSLLASRRSAVSAVAPGEGCTFLNLAELLRGRRIVRRHSESPKLTRLVSFVPDGPTSPPPGVIGSLGQFGVQLFAYHLHQHPLRPPAVELAVEDLLPRAEVELAVA